MVRLSLEQIMPRDVCNGAVGDAHRASAPFQESSLFPGPCFPLTQEH